MGSGEYRNVDDPERAMAAIRDMIDDSAEIVVVSAPITMVDELEAELQAALDRGVLVLLLVGGTSIEDARDRTYPATLVRYWESVADFVVSVLVDHDRGVISQAKLPEPEAPNRRAFVYRDPFIADMQFNTIVIARWQRNPQVFVRDPPSLPRAYESFFEAVIDGARHLRDERPLAARVEGVETTTDERVEVAGPVLNVRQNLVSPTTNTFQLEQTIFVDDGSDVVSVGGPRAQVEDLRCRRVELFEE